MPIDFRFSSPLDGLDLVGRKWQPASTQAVIVFVHGFCEHAGRYSPFAERLHDEGYAVYAPDLRGHGRSCGEPIYVHAFDCYLADLEPVVDLAEHEHPGQPIFLVGHSMGGAIAGAYAIANPGRLAGLILSAAAINVAGNLFPILRHLATVMSWLFPRLRVVRVGTRWLSRDPQVVADFRSDPLVFQGKLPVRTGAEILRAARRLHRRLAELNLPLLVLHGTGDRITDPMGSRAAVNLAAGPDKTLQLYPDLYHDLFHEPEHNQVEEDVLTWLRARAHT